MRAEYPGLPSATPSPRVAGPLCDLFGWGEAVAGIAQGVATTVAAHEQASAARDAARMAADAATHGADLQDAAAQRAEAFQREQADYAGQQQEVDRRANYGQYAANRRRIGSLGTMLGLGGVEVPDYVPGVVPHYANAPAGAIPVGAGQSPAAAAARPTNFGAVLAPGGPPSPGVPAPGAPPLDPRLTAGNGGFAGGMGTPVLQPDGTYAIPPSMPRYRTVGQYLGAA